MEVKSTAEMLVNHFPGRGVFGRSPTLEQGCVEQNRLRIVRGKLPEKLALAASISGRKRLLEQAADHLGMARI